MLDNKRGLLRLFVLVFLFAAVIFPAAAQTPVSHPKLETSDETNARIRELAGTALIGSKPSRIGPGDLIGVEVFDVPELTREARVSDSGFISMPLVGVPIQVNGLTTAEAEEKISEILQVKGLVTHPEVMVSVREEKSQPITVVGEVRNPQVIQAVRSMRLLEVLSAAGGISENAGNVVLITRPASSQPGAKAGFDGPNSTDTPDVEDRKHADRPDDDDDYRQARRSTERSRSSAQHPPLWRRHRYCAAWRNFLYSRRRKSSRRVHFAE